MKKSYRKNVSKKIVDARGTLVYHRFQHWKGGDPKIYEF